LRARYLSNVTGRFLTRDEWAGDGSSPLTLNKYLYTNGNPVNYADPSGHCIIVVIGDTLACAVVIAGLVIVVYIAGRVIGDAIVQHSDEIATAIDVQCKAAQQFAQDLLNGNSPVAQPEKKREPYYYKPDTDTDRDDDSQLKVLIVGEAPNYFGYSKSLHSSYPDWEITGSSYGSSNTQNIVETDGKLRLLANVDATKLETGPVTGVELYDAVIFNNPYASDGRDRSHANLISAFIRSARTRLNKSGTIQINVTQTFLIRYALAAAELGLPDNSSERVAKLPRFGDTIFYAPYYPRYSTGEDIRWFDEDPTRVWYLKNFSLR
jgi:hypothetical protein